MRIDGTEIANRIFEKLKAKVKKIREKNIIPHLAIILVGEDPASITYVRQKKLKGDLIGAKVAIEHLPASTSETQLLKLIERFNYNNSIHGIIVQQPLPTNINIEKITQAIDLRKDVDGFHSKSKFQPPIALAVLQIIKPFLSKSKKILVIGKGETGGKPIIQELKKIGIEPIIVDSKTKKSKALIKNADIVISAVGKSNVIKANMISKGSILISIGMHKDIDGKLHGDYNEEEIKNIASFYTPTPGGVGPVNVAMLLKNLVNSAETLVSH